MKFLLKAEACRLLNLDVSSAAIERYATMPPLNAHIKVEKDDTPQPFSKNFDQFGNSSGFIFDVSLSTAVAADGKNEERAPKPRVLSRRDAGQDESLLARRELSLHRPNLPL